MHVKAVDESVLKELEEQGGLAKNTLQVRKNHLEHFKQWVLDTTGKDLEQFFNSKEGKAEFSKLFGR